VIIRQGRKNPRNLYVQAGDDPADADISIGYIRLPAVAACLADVPLAAIYTSPLLRARQTTAAIAAYHAVPVRRSALLLEIGTSWAGTRWTWARRR